MADDKFFREIMQINAKGVESSSLEHLFKNNSSRETSTLVKRLSGIIAKTLQVFNLDRAERPESRTKQKAIGIRKDNLHIPGFYRTGKDSITEDDRIMGKNIENSKKTLKVH